MKKFIVVWVAVAVVCLAAVPRADAAKMYWTDVGDVGDVGGGRRGQGRRRSRLAGEV